MPLDGADAQALEHALTITERELSDVLHGRDSPHKDDATTHAMSFDAKLYRSAYRDGARELIDLRARVAELERERDALREALLLLPMDCDCGERRAMTFTNAHYADCPVYIRDRALATATKEKP